MQIVSLINVPCGAYLDHSYAEDLASTPFTGICCDFENWRDLHALSGKFLWQKSCCPESFRFFWLCNQPTNRAPNEVTGLYLDKNGQIVNFWAKLCCFRPKIPFFGKEENHQGMVMVVSSIFSLIPLFSCKKWPFSFSALCSLMSGTGLKTKCALTENRPLPKFPSYGCLSVGDLFSWKIFTQPHCTMCRLGSIFSFQPNKLRHI